MHTKRIHNNIIISLKVAANNSNTSLLIRRMPQWYLHITDQYLLYVGASSSQWIVSYLPTETGEVNRNANRNGKDSGLDNGRKGVYILEESIISTRYWSTQLKEVSGGKLKLQSQILVC